MATYVVLLRGVNVGGHKVPTADLQQTLAAMGLSDVRTYIQTGNLVLRSPMKPSELSQRLEARLGATFGFEIAALIRTKSELDRVVAANPLRRGRDPAKLHVTFLAAKPKATRLDGAFGPDEYAVVGREVYLHCPGGYGRTKLNNAFLERRLEVAATTRNWRTVTTLAEMAG
ncbi:MAG TPA: DUF1697 domain-containing protein [Acidimicrobiales bacterium]|nr:DUF1697 domain-containing protein [Acidimicrobiales bacterium]